MKDVVDAIEASLPERRPCFIGVSGAVAIGKTTVAAALGEGFAARVISTDAFLFPNEILNARDLLMRKGFPETYDTDRVGEALGRLADGRPVDLPVYSHDAYDIVDGALDHVAPTDVIVIEGVVALQEPIRSYLDIALYIDAPADLVKGWFAERFGRFVADAKDDPASFYHQMSALAPDAVRQIADLTWDAINAVNLKEHIAPSGIGADVVLEKGPGHSIVRLSKV